jgi:HrpA-like RNA helicase
MIFLVQSGAITKDNKFTKFGNEMSAYPTSICLARTILKSFELNCANHVITICSIFEPNTSLFQADCNPINKNFFSSNDGDHLLLLHKNEE